MAQYDYDLFVIGAGSGGVRAARLAAMAGARVGVAEEDRAGGTCVVRGCVPKKFMVYASDFAHQLRTMSGYGWTVGEASFDWKTFIQKKDIEIARLSGIYATNLAKSGAELIHAKARFLGPHALELVGKDRTVTARQILIAVGGRPVMPEVPGIEHAISSNEAFHLPERPRRVLVVGGGYIAVEFAGIFNGLGAETTLLYRGPNILRGFDEDVRSHLSDEIVKRGVRLVVGAQHVSIDKTPEGLVSRLTNDMPSIASDVVMFATGRAPYLEGLGLDKAGVALNERGAIAVDDYSRTNVEHIWAVGDVTDRINLTPVAIREGAAFVETAIKGVPTRFDHEMVPTAVFSQPPVGTVGMSEGEARQAFGKVDIYLSRFRPMRYAFMGGEDRMLMKLIVDQASQRIVGCHIVGEDAPEIVQMAAVAVKAGVTKEQWDSTCALHPTVAEELVTMREKYVSPELGAA